MDLSRRLSALQGAGDDGWQLHYRATAMHRAGKPVLFLTVGEHDNPTPSEILTAMDASARDGATGYMPAAGLPALRNAIAARIEARTGVATTPENVLITAGGQAALYAAMMAVLDLGETALFPDPYYATYPGTIRAVGGCPKPIPTRPEDRFRPSAAELAKAAPNARCLLINTPNNPTGQVYDRLTLARIAAACIEHDLWLVSDEVYETQVWSGAHVSPRELPGMAERTLVIGSMSKSYAMTGSRLGWLVAPKHVVSALTDLSTNTTYGLPGFIQAAALWALRQGESLEAQVAEPFRRRRGIATDLMRHRKGIEALPLDGGMFLMLDIRGTGLTGIAFAERLLTQQNIAVMPGESFGVSSAGHIRVALTVPDDVLADALQRIAAFAETYPLAATG